MIPNDFIQTLLGRVDIVDVIDRHVKLKKAGANLVACCPFHQEKSPSFSVSPAKQFYHCFGCGAHGSAITFLMEYSGAGFIDAVKELAASVGLAVPEVRRESASGQPLPAVTRDAAESLGNVLRRALDHYRAALRTSEAAIAYLKRRGLTGAIAARYGLGYAPDAWQSLATAVADYDDPLLVTAGLVIESPAEAGKPARRYDRFRDRVMFPILDSRGQVIGFGGRVIGAGEPKYLNSPETPVFEKGRELYGLYQARRAIRDTNRVLVVEGYMDVVALAQHGVENAVATLGTATTPTHVQKLLRLADDVVFAFDGDAAGQKAAWRALETTLPLVADGKSVRFLFLPSDDDPDSYVRREGKAGFLAAQDGAMPLTELLISELVRRHPPDTPEQKARLVEAARPLVGQLEAPVLAHFVRSRLAAVLGVSREDFTNLLPPVKSGQGERAARHLPAPRTPARLHPLEARILARLVAFPGLVRTLTETVRALPELPAVSEVARFIDESAEAVNAGMLVTCFAESEHHAMLGQALADPLFGREDFSEAEAATELQESVEQVTRDHRRSELVARLASGLSPSERKELADLMLGVRPSLA
jgi:DNA primase